MSETKKTGSSITKEFSEDLPLPANSRGKNSALSRENLVATETTEMPQEAERHWGRQQALLLRSKLHQSCFLFPSPHLCLSACSRHSALPSAGHSACTAQGLTFPPALPALQAPANTPQGAAANHPHSFKSNTEEKRALSELSSTRNSNLVTSSCSSLQGFWKNVVILDFKKI